jgi:amino-acid N-acetyltransferase
MPFQIRPAVPQDIPGINALVGRFANRGLILPRSSDEIEASIGDWFVGVSDELVIACGSLLAYSETLSEVRSLVVDERHQRLGLGKAILNCLIDMAHKRKIANLFALTRVKPIFEDAGFEISARERFPEKVWRDCVLCPIQQSCDEEALVLSMNDVQRSVPKAE